MSTKLFLNALIPPNWPRQRSPHLHTAGFSSENLDTLLESGPTAITVSSAGALNAEQLLDAYQDKTELFANLAGSQQRNWCVIKATGGQQIEIVKPVERSQLFSVIDALSSQLANRSSVYAIVPEMSLSPEKEREIREGVSRIIEHSLTNLKLVTAGELTEREKLLRERQRMMDEVGIYTSEELAAAARSTTINPSQFAADQRNAGRIFGMKHGQSWRYPEFQFDSQGQVFPEVETVVKALSPDEQGWDRLQWFLEPHEKLGGRTPFEVWRTDRQKVVEAATTEHWDGRD